MCLIKGLLLASVLKRLEFWCLVRPSLTVQNTTCAYLMLVPLAVTLIAFGQSHQPTGKILKRQKALNANTAVIIPPLEQSGTATGTRTDLQG